MADNEGVDVAEDLPFVDPEEPMGADFFTAGGRCVWMYAISAA